MSELNAVDSRASQKTGRCTVEGWRGQIGEEEERGTKTAAPAAFCHMDEFDLLSFLSQLVEIQAALQQAQSAPNA